MPRPQVLLDENVVMANELYKRQGETYESIGKALKEELRRAGLEATFVGDADPAVDLAHVKPHYWRQLKGAQLVAAVNDCGRRFETARARPDEDRDAGWKACVNQAQQQPGEIVRGGPHRVPPRGARDADIADWAEKNAVLIVSFDADVALEPQVASDRILLNFPDVDCGPHRRRICKPETRTEVTLLADHVRERLDRILRLLSGPSSGK